MSNPFAVPRTNEARPIFIFDPDASVCETLSVLFRIEGHETRFALDADTLQENLTPKATALFLGAGQNPNWMQVLKRLRATMIGTPIFVLCPHDDAGIAAEAMKAGAFDVVMKPINQKDALRALSAALDTNIRWGAASDIGRTVWIHGFEQLTPREREVLELITNGCTNKEAGRKLRISPRTIEVHRGRIMDKLYARNTADLMRIVLAQ